MTILVKDRHRNTECYRLWYPAYDLRFRSFARRSIYEWIYNSLSL